MNIIDNKSFSNNLNFGRKLYPAEAKKYKKTVQKGLKVLNKEVGVIVHNSTTPSNSNINTGIGSLLSLNAEQAFIPMLAMHGVTKIQQEPDNIRHSSNPSPYMPFATSKNVYMIPLEKLATKEYGEILPKIVLNTIVVNRPNMETNEVDYNYVAENYDSALKIAYTNFHEKIANPDNYELEEIETLAVLKNEFEQFKSENYEEMEPHAFYEILTKLNNDTFWKKWNNTDKNLYKSGNPRQAQRQINRINQLRTDFALDIDFFLFKQMLVEKEIAKSQERGEVNFIADCPIAFTDVEVWKNQDLFFNDLALGCPPDELCQEGQRWGYAVLRPETIFNEDGSLGEGGELLQKRYEKIFKNANGGVRLDHIIGLIDPFVYKTTEKIMLPENSGRLYSSPKNDLLSKYTKTSDEEYATILTKIIIPAAEKYGLSKDDIICEDFGEITAPVKAVMDMLGLKGVAVTQFDKRGVEQPENKVIMIGSHDNKSAVEYARDLYEKAEENRKDRKFLDRKIDYLVADTIIPSEKPRKYKKQIKNCQADFIKASFAELFTSPAKDVQISFTDFFGLDKTYNKPGSKKDCWRVRMPDNIERIYYENLKKNKGINMPEVLARAIRNKGEDFSSQHEELLEDLDKFAKLLKF